MTSESAETKHEMVAEALRTRIADMRPEDVLPAERELSAEFGVNRSTIRQALRTLKDEGLICVVHGSGTYVAPRGSVSRTLQLKGFSQDMIQHGRSPSSKILRLETVPARDAVAANLGLAPGTNVVHAWRIRLADGTPMVLEHSWLSESVAAALDFQGPRSLYDQLSSAGHDVTRSEQTVRAINLDAEQALHLHQAVGAAALSVHQVAHTDAGQAIEYAESVYRGDCYSFEITVTRES